MKHLRSDKKRKKMRRDRLRKRRDEMGFTQQELADVTSISIAQIQRYEDEEGTTTPSVDKLGALAKALDVSADYLMGLSDHPHGEVTFKDLSPEEQRLITAYRQSTNASDRVANVFFALTVDEDLMDELSTRSKSSSN